MVQIDTDPYPDIALGRVPASTSSEVVLFVEKVIRYENNLSSNNSTSIAAFVDPSENRFRGDAVQFLSTFPDNGYAKLLIDDYSGDKKIIDWLNDGQRLAAYFGHGSISMWGKDSLFSSQDIDKLKNESNLTIVLNLTCLTGFFTHPTEKSLAEELLLDSPSGAIAVLAPTSLTLTADQKHLSTAIAKGFSTSSDLRLGDIIVNALSEIPDNSPTAIDVIKTFMLFGDPALKIFP